VAFPQKQTIFARRGRNKVIEETSKHSHRTTVGPHLLPPIGATLFLLNSFAVRAFAVADLLRREHSSANAATPARKCGLRDYRHRLLIGAPGPH
jgi:hypothetical protein